MRDDDAAANAGSVGCSLHAPDHHDGADWVEISGVHVELDGAQADDPSVADGTGGVSERCVTAADGAGAARVETERMAGVVARRHAQGFAVRGVLPLIEFYLLHVYVLLQFALLGR